MTVLGGPALAPDPVSDQALGPRLVRSLLENTRGLLLGMHTCRIIPGWSFLHVGTVQARHTHTHTGTADVPLPRETNGHECIKVQTSANAI